MNDSLGVPAGPLRRLGVLVYDALLVVAIILLATLLLTIVKSFFPGAKDRVLMPSEVGAWAYLYWFVQLVIVSQYFAFFWTRKRRTLGMQAWRLWIERKDGEPVRWSDAMARFLSATLPWLPAFLVMTIADRVDPKGALMTVGISFLALAPLNYLAAYLTKEKCALHDLLLNTRIRFRR